MICLYVAIAPATFRCDCRRFIVAIPMISTAVWVFLHDICSRRHAINHCEQKMTNLVLLYSYVSDADYASPFIYIRLDCWNDFR